MDWLEISLTVNGELAEAVADVLARYCPGGVTTEQAVRYVDDWDEGTAGGPITVRAYVPPTDEQADVRGHLERALGYLAAIQPFPPPKFRLVADQNWMEAWREHYQPIEVGRQLIVAPAWNDIAPPGKTVIKIDPGMAFGTGTHPSTQLCLALLEDMLGNTSLAEYLGRSSEREGLIDIGCGSGILSIAALKLGARWALGVDVDPVAIENARANAELNGIGEELLLGTGTVRQILDGHFGPRSARIVCANILAPVIVKLLDEGLARVVQPGGALVVAGILETQIAVVEAAVIGAGLALQKRQQMGEWVAAVCVAS